MSQCIINFNKDLTNFKVFRYDQTTYRTALIGGQKYKCNFKQTLGPHFLCSISELISTWEDVVTSWANAQNDIMSLKICSRSCHFVSCSAWTTVIFFSAWDKSRVKWDRSWNSTQKMRTYAPLCSESAIQSIQACRRNERLISKQVQVGKNWEYLQEVWGWIYFIM